MPYRRVALLLVALALPLACGRDGGEDAASSNATPSLSWTVPPDATPTYPHVILVTIDTLRADHLPSYGYPRPTAPFLERLAEHGVLFRRALAQMPHTAPSHASMLTGLPPGLHGVLQNGETLASDVPTLANLFTAAGFDTAAFLSVRFLGAIAGSFGHLEAKTMTAAPLVDHVLEWVRAEPRERFFLWIHLYEPHRWKKRHFVMPDALATVRTGTKVEHARFYATLAALHGLPDPPPGEPFHMEWDGKRPDGTREEPPSRETFVEHVDAYDALVLQADRELARLYDALAELRLSGPTLWIVTADHGEGLGSHGYAGHGAHLYEEQVRVPLVFHATDGSLPAHEVDALAQHLDLVPTLAELVGAHVDVRGPELLGRSLVPLLRGDASESTRRFALSEKRRSAENVADDAFALQDGAEKLIRHGDGREEFFRLHDDPLELHPLDADDAERAELRRRLEAYLAIVARSGRAEESGPAPEFAEELRDLGY